MICPNCGFDNVPGNESCTNCQQALSPLDLPTPQNQIERSLMEGGKVKTASRLSSFTFGTAST